MDLTVCSPNPKARGAPWMQWESRVRCYGCRTVVSALLGGSHLDFVLVRREDGVVLEIRARPELLDAAPNVVWLHQGGSASEGVFRACSVVDCSVQWDLVSFSCDVLDEAHLNSCVPGWTSIVTVALRSHSLRNTDRLTLLLGGREVTFDIYCRERNLLHERSSTFGSCHRGTQIVHQRMRKIEPQLDTVFLEGNVALDECLVIGLSTGHHVASSVVEGLIRRAAPVVCVWTAVEATAQEDVILVGEQTGCKMTILLLGVDAIVGSPSRLNRLALLLSSRGRDTSVVLSASDATALPSVLTAKIDQYIRVRASPSTKGHDWQLDLSAFEGTIGLEDVVSRLSNTLIDLKRGSSAKVVWLYGDPGSGKTHICRAVERAFSDSKRVFQASIARLVHAYIGDSEKALAELFRKARDSCPSAIILDGADGLFGNLRNGLFSQFVQEIDELSGSGSSVLVLLTSSGPLSSRLGPALIQGGRVDLALPLEAPTESARRALLEYMGVDPNLKIPGDTFGGIVSAARAAKAKIH